MEYQPTVGLEIHTQLKTKTKMFCDTPNGFGLETEPNVHICPVCTGQPGTLPVINKRAVSLTVKTGLALNCKITDESWFERKNYFYPDLPKGYQISQYEKPLCENGYLSLSFLNGEEKKETKVKITRIHLEEDTGKLIHDQDPDYSLVDFNRAGVPLMELVTEPDITSGKEAKKFCEELQLILRYLEVSDADMEKGQMRCEVNISLKNPDGSFGTKVEIKNLNSFRVVEQSIDYEIKRQSELLDQGEKIIQETRGWDEGKARTISQRAKEEAHDYRYFPEPDLPSINVTSIKEIEEKNIPELPQDKRDRFGAEYGLPKSDIETLAGNKNLADYFEKVSSELNNWIQDEGINDKKEKLIKLSANYLITELQKLLYQAKINIIDCKIDPENFAEFVALIGQNKISSSAAQTVLKEMFDSGKDPSQIIVDKDLSQISDEGALEEIVKTIIANNQNVVEDYKKGKEQALQFLVGQVMKETKGKANPGVAKEILVKVIG